MVYLSVISSSSNIVYSQTHFRNEDGAGGEREFFAERRFNTYSKWPMTGP
jgi:hypothetical protein